jgi:lysozyme
LVKSIAGHESFHTGNQCPSCGCPRDPLGIATIGYGRNIRDRGITRKEGEYLLKNDAIISALEVEELFENWVEIGDVRQEVLIEMGYNLGITKLRQFEKMIVAVQLGDWNRAALEMRDSRWYRQVGQRGRTLELRMQTGAQ